MQRPSKKRIIVLNFNRIGAAMLAVFGAKFMIGMVLAMEIPVNSVGEGCLAWLDVAKEKNAVRIEAYCRCREQSDILYRLTTVTSGSSGTSRSSQQSKKGMSAGASIRLAGIRLEKSPSRNYSVELEIYQNGILSARTQIKSNHN